MSAPIPDIPLTLFAAGDALDRATRWSTLAADERRRRAVQACRDHDAQTLWAITDAWLTLHGKRGATVAALTRRNYQKGLHALLEAWARDDLLRPARDAGALWLARLQTRKLQPASIKVHLAGARAFYAALRWTGATAADPFRDARAPTDPTPQHDKRHPYSPVELETLLDAATPRERVLLLLAGHAGLRSCELVTIRWSDLDLAAASLVVRHGKGGKTRAVALSRSTVDALQAFHAAQHPVPDADDYVLGGSTKTARVQMGLLCARATVPRRGLHALRHSAGTRLIKECGDLEMVARHLGHQSIETARVYAKWSDERLKTTMGGW